MNQSWKEALGVVLSIAKATGITQAQLTSWAKTSLGIIGTAAVSHGIGTETTWEAVSGVVVMIAPYVWGYVANTILAQVTQTSKLPAVEKVVLKPSVGNGLAAAAADPGQPKIVKAQ